MIPHSSLLLLLPFLSSVFSLKCYVCGPDNGIPEEMLQLRRSFPQIKIQACSAYKPAMKDLYLVDCPANSNGCLTEIEADGSVKRTCASIGIDDCQSANGVNYCYCSTPGCNNPSPRLADPAPRHGHKIDFNAGHGLNTPVDDEDTVIGGAEGSGDGGEDDWGHIYYDSYYGVDTEPGFGPDFADMTEQPSYMKEELQEEYDRISRLNNQPTSKYDRQPVVLENEIIIVEETVTVRPHHVGAGAGAISPASLATLLFLLALRFTV